jgi:catechol 2,3-dioxygenase-like lactoylglutathione lyase family enzyme
MSRATLLGLVAMAGAFVAGALAGVSGGRLIGQEAQSRSAQPFVTGIGGVFFKADNPRQLQAWYREHLGIEPGAQGVNFLWRDRDNPEVLGLTVWSVFPRATNYFGAADQELMINYRVRDLDRLLEKLRAEGISEARAGEEYDYGRFAWIVDGEGNRIELWEPDE